MTKLRMGDRALKVAMLIAGMRDRRVSPLLRPYGFTEADIEEGWRRFLRFATAKVGAVASTARGPEVQKELQRVEERWFSVAKLALGHRFPALEVELFSGFEGAHGKNVYWKVAFFVQRLEAMGQGREPFGAEGPLARELLRTRGLSDAEESHACELVRSMTSLEPVEEVQDDHVIVEAEAEMMAWYKEWSGLLRREVSDKNLRRMLGLAKRRGESEAAVEVIEVTPNPVGGAATAPALPAAPGPSVASPPVAVNAAKADPGAAE